MKWTTLSMEYQGERIRLLYSRDRFFNDEREYHCMKLGDIEAVGHSFEECATNFRKQLDMRRVQT